MQFERPSHNLNPKTSKKLISIQLLKPRVAIHNPAVLKYFHILMCTIQNIFDNIRANLGLVRQSITVSKQIPSCNKSTDWLT